MLRDLCIARATQRVKGLANLHAAPPASRLAMARPVAAGHSAVGGANLIESTTASQSASMHKSVIARC